MTNEKAIDLLDNLLGMFDDNQNNDYDEAIYMAIDALSVEPIIIRCKDCKYASPNGKYGCKAYHFKQYEVHEMYAYDFCSFAERREDA